MLSPGQFVDLKLDQTLGGEVDKSASELFSRIARERAHHVGCGTITVGVNGEGRREPAWPRSQTFGSPTVLSARFGCRPSWVISMPSKGMSAWQVHEPGNRHGHAAVVT